MTDQQESGLITGGAGMSNQQVSETGDKQPSVDVEAVVTAVVDRLRPELEGIAERQWQSGKDRRIAKLESDVSDFGAQLARLRETQRKYNISEDEALFRMEVEDALLAKRTASPESASPTQKADNQTGSEATADAELLEVLGLDKNDAEVANLLRSGKTSASDFIALAKSRRKKEEAPNPAAVVPTGGGSSASSDLMEEYRQKAAKLPRGSHALLNLRAEYRKKGLNV